MTKTIRVVHVVSPARKPDDYILTKPEGLDAFKAVRIVKCPFGPLVEWKMNATGRCSFCEGDGDIEVRGKDHSYEHVDCPRCDGAGTIDAIDSDEPGTWSDSDGNIVTPDLIQHSTETTTISESWLREWVRQKDTL